MRSPVAGAAQKDDGEQKEAKLKDDGKTWEAAKRQVSCRSSEVCSSNARVWGSVLMLFEIVLAFMVAGHSGGAHENPERHEGGPPSLLPAVSGGRSDEAACHFRLSDNGRVPFMPFMSARLPGTAWLRKELPGLTQVQTRYPATRWAELRYTMLGYPMGGTETVDTLVPEPAVSVGGRTTGLPQEFITAVAYAAAYVGQQRPVLYGTARMLLCARCSLLAARCYTGCGAEKAHAVLCSSVAGRQEQRPTTNGPKRVWTRRAVPRYAFGRDMWY
eukprot:360183-Rhodomonas_salina.1